MKVSKATLPAHSPFFNFLPHCSYTTCDPRIRLIEKGGGLCPHSNLAQVSSDNIFYFIFILNVLCTCFFPCHIDPSSKIACTGNNFFIINRVNIAISNKKTHLISTFRHLFLSPNSFLRLSLFLRPRPPTQPPYPPPLHPPPIPPPIPPH